MNSTLFNHAAAWETAKLALKNRLPGNIFDQWFADIHFAGFEDDTFHLVSSDLFAVIVISENYTDIVEEVLRTVTGRSVRFKIERVESKQAPDAELELPLNIPANPEPRPAPAAPTKPAAPVEELSPAIRRQNTFENFVRGPENQMACAISESLANNLSDPDGTNPLFIYGPSGVGKTHLMHAIANAAFAKNGSARICYVTCEMFTNDYTYALSQNAVHEFRRRYRNLNLLLVDDIQFLEGKKGLQEEFFHTFNELIINGCKIVLTSDRPASEIQIEDRLISRFQQGISADITPPNLEVRIAILLRKAAMKHFDFTQHPGLLEFVAQNITRNVRNLEGAVNTLARYLEISNKSSLTPDDAKSILSSLLGQEESAKITPEYIQRLVAEAYRIEVDQMTRKGRGRAEIAFARQVAMYLCREVIDITLSAIGDAFGGRDHGTVLNAVKAVTNRMTTSDADRTKIAQLRSKLNTSQAGA